MLENSHGKKNRFYKIIKGSGGGGQFFHKPKTHMCVAELISVRMIVFDSVSVVMCAPSAIHESSFKVLAQHESHSMFRCSHRITCGTRMYVCMHVCMYVFMHACMHVCMSVCLYVCIHGCMYVCVYVCMYVCMCTCMYA
jgi:hypothetical protein